ncbi:hypothetical protein OA667_02380 [Prochlorococcus sp. AH-716-G10]|nr:hypothetical protein [Prochlorococcus sp. AH-716-G10]
MIEEGEIIEILVENPTYFTKAKQQEIGVIVFSSLTIVLLLLAITIRNRNRNRNRPENIARRKELKEAGNERNQEARENYIKDLMSDPYLNIVKEDFFEVHKERLKKHRVSIYQRLTYYLGKKGGLYYRSSKGTRIYI